MTILAMNRNFRVWGALVSHNQLLLRSATTGGYPTNIDIRFYAVRYLCIPTIFHGLTLRHGTSKDVASVQALMGEIVAQNRIFILETKERRHFIVASSVHIEENDLDMFESSLGFKSRPT